MILLNDFKRQWQATGTDALEAFRGVGESGWYILGESVSQFEKALGSYWGISEAVGVASGLDAIEISLRVLGCGPGDEVLTSPISAFATVLAILKLGATPVFADCDPYGLIDLETCREILKQRPQVRYFVPVHLYGHALNLDKLRRLREDFNLKVVEDCAQAIGARFGGEPAGAIGQMCATSFYPTKNLGALGDGGAILTNDAALAEAARRLRDYGQSGKYHHDTLGYNSRLDELQAAFLGRVGLPNLRDWTETRRRVATEYLGGIQHGRVNVPGVPDGSESCWHLFPVLIEPEQKPGFRDHLKSCGVATAEHYPLALVEQKALTDRYDYAGQCCQARKFCHAEVSLPIHPYLTNKEVARVIEACNSWAA